jgi:DNA invertase Pin-like site-specific DNA recombinase
MKKSILSCKSRTAVAYARYSSAGQRDVSIEQQLRDIRAFADREGYTIVHEYTDHAKSGYKNTSARAEFQAMIAAAASGSFDTVLCWKVDRFGRRRADSALYKDKLAQLGVSVVYVMEPMPGGSAGVLSVGMLEAIAEWYSANLSENVTRGMLDNARKCLYNGTKVFGYACGPDHHYMIVPEEAATVLHIFARYLAGYSAQVICNELNASGLRTSRGCRFTPQLLLRIISNERYTGTYIWGDIRTPGGMPAIISRKDWEEAQRMKKKTARHVEQRAVDFLLTGKAFCGLCEKSMIGDSGTSKSGNTYYYYTCQGHKARSGCPKKNHRKDVLEDQVVNFLMDRCLTESELEKIADLVVKDMETRKNSSPLASMKQELEEVKKKIANTNRAISAGIYGKSTLEMLAELEEDAEDLKKTIAIHEYAEAQLVDRDRCLFFLTKFTDLDRNDPEDRRKLIHYFLNAVYVYDDHLKIVTNFIEGTETIPLEALPDLPECSDNVTDPVLVRTHPNTTALLYVVRI